MLRSMVFIDYQNFNINLQKLYSHRGMKAPSINHSKLALELNKQVKLRTEMIKTYLFVAKPNEKLLTLESYKKQYDWVCSLKNKQYFEVIEGRQEIRHIDGVKFDIEDRTTYTTVEKGTDVNVALHMLSKGYQNAYDVAILVSGDSDYIPVVETLHHMGKIVVLATLSNQNVDKYELFIDQRIPIDDYIIESSKRFIKK